MAMAYIKLYYDLLESLTPFQDAEVGRLIRALLEYAISGTEPDLKGNERFIWPTLRGAVDRDAEQYAAKCEKLRENGRLGGRGNKAEGFSEKQKLSEKANGFSEKQKLPRQDKDKDKDKDVVNNGDEDELYQLADQFNDVLDAAEAIGLGSSADLSKANLLVADYSAKWVLEAIRRTANAPPNARCWRYIEGILRRWKEKGGIDGREKSSQQTECEQMPPPSYDTWEEMYG